MACAEGGECGGEFIQVVRAGDGGKRGGLLGHRSHDPLSLVCCSCSAFGGRSQLLGVLFGCFGSLLCLTVRGHGVGHVGFEGGQVGIGLGEVLPLLAQCEELVPGSERPDLFCGPGVCGLCCVVNLGRFGERASGSGKGGIESGNVRWYLDGGQRPLPGSQFAEMVASVGDGLRGLLEVGKSRCR